MEIFEHEIDMVNIMFGMGYFIKYFGLMILILSWIYIALNVEGDKIVIFWLFSTPAYIIATIVLYLWKPWD